MAEPGSTAWILSALGALVLLSAMLSRAAGRVGIPASLFFFVLGILVGTEGFFGVTFADYDLSFRLGTVALVLILFDGGLHTPMSAVPQVLAPASVLATFGVVLSTLTLAWFASWTGATWDAAFLIGAIVGSTDAAAVFAVLRSSGVQLSRRVGSTLELESGLNDPMAVMLTVAWTHAIIQGETIHAGLLLDVFIQLAVGLIVGVLLGELTASLLRRARLLSSGLYPAITTGLALCAYGLATLLHGSGFLAVFLAGLFLARDEHLPFRRAVQRTHEATAWLSQIMMFLLLGLLVKPSMLFSVLDTGIAWGLFLAFVARPLAVLICLIPFGFRTDENLFIAWVGLRGAVPIVLATYPVLRGVPGAEQIFHQICCIVVVNALVPGSTVARLAIKLGLSRYTPPPSPAVLDINSTQRLNKRVVSFHVDRASAAANVQVGQLPLPEGAAMILMVRGHCLLAGRADETLLPGDHLYLICDDDHVPVLGLFFGRPEE